MTQARDLIKLDYIEKRQKIFGFKSEPDTFLEQKGDEDDVIVDEELLVGRLSAARVKNCPSLAQSLRTVCIHKVGGGILTMMLC